MPLKSSSFIKSLSSAIPIFLSADIQTSFEVLFKESLQQNLSTRSHLLLILICGISSKFRSVNILFTSISFCFQSTSEASTTWSNKSADLSSSNVALNDSTS